MLDVFTEFSSKEVLYSGFIMNKDIPSVRVDRNKVTSVINPTLSPYYIRRTKDFRSWVMNRSIDSHRTNSRILRKMLRLKNPDTLDVSMKFKCRSITDSFWFKEDGNNLSYNDLMFNDDSLKDVALLGRFDSLEVPQDMMSPELTNIGSFEKCWALDKDNDWWLRKVANKYELFSEVFVYMLCTTIGYSAVPYRRVSDRNIIECPNFVDKDCWFESMFSLVGEEEDYGINYDILGNLDSFYSLTLRKDYLNILFIDAIAQNPDRHTNNYGFIVNNGDIVELAPNFDNNLALLSRGVLGKQPSAKNPLISDFISLVKERDLNFDIPKLDLNLLHSLVKECCSKVGIESLGDIEIGNIGEYIYHNYCLIKESLLSGGS